MLTKINVLLGMIYLCIRPKIIIFLRVKCLMPYIINDTLFPKTLLPSHERGIPSASWANKKEAFGSSNLLLNCFHMVCNWSACHQIKPISLYQLKCRNYQKICIFYTYINFHVALIWSKLSKLSAFGNLC